MVTQIGLQQGRSRTSLSSATLTRIHGIYVCIREQFGRVEYAGTRFTRGRLQPSLAKLAQHPNDENQRIHLPLNS